MVEAADFKPNMPLTQRLVMLYSACNFSGRLCVGCMSDRTCLRRGHLVTLCLLLLTCTHSYAAFIHYRSRNTFPGTEDRLLNESAQHNFLSGKALFPIVVGVGFGYGGLWC